MFLHDWVHMKSAKHRMVTSCAVAPWTSVRVIAFGTAADARKLTILFCQSALLVILLETRVSGQRVGWILAPFCVRYFKIIALESQVPVFDARWWFRLGIAEDQLNRLAICDQFEMTTKEVEVESLNCPDNCQCFSFCLRIASFNVGEGSTGICNYSSVLLSWCVLHQDGRLS